MKKILFFCCALLTLCIAHAQFPNVSTGITTGGLVLPANTPDPNWVLVSPSPVFPNAYIEPNNGLWQPTPVTGTNAGWINPSTNPGLDKTGIYWFERNFHISAGTGSFTCNFRVADDDVLVSLDLIRPNATTISLPVTLVSNQYHLSQPITTVVNCPDTGTWTIRAEVHYIDGLGGFLLSGYINTSTKVTCDTTCSLLLYGVNGSGPFACGSTIKLTCNNSYDFGPQLSCKGNGCGSNIISVTLKDPSNNTPSWASSFLSNLGNGLLSIPGAIQPGIYTLTYNYGINGQICGTCKFKLNITCKSCNCTLKNTVTINGIRKTLKCADTLILSCGTTTNSFSTSLSCNGDPDTHIIAVKILDANGNPVSWANADFFTNLGNGNLIIPSGTSGFYTLRYVWGKNCQPCDSCSYTLKIQCCGNFTVDAGPDLVKCTATVQLGVTKTGGTNPLIYSWSPTTGLNNPDIPNPTCSTTGTYVVTVTDAVGCIKTDTVKIVSGGNGCKPMAQDMQQNKLNTASNKLQAVPNPYTNSFTIKGLESTAASLDILTVEGKTITHYSNIFPQQSFGKGLGAGVYLIKIFYKDGSTKTLKTIKN